METVFGQDHAQANLEFGACRRYPSPPPAVHLNGTGLGPVPALSRKQTGQEGPAAFDLNSNPGIRRPRWGGVVEGVAGQIRHPLAYEMSNSDGLKLGRSNRGDDQSRD